MYDIAIIGLGPAGATLARLLDKRLSVIAIDKKSAGGVGGFHKPCGGLLATDAQKALSRFNLNLPLDVMVGPQLFSVRTIDVKAKQIRHYQRFYINLDRHKFDLWLKSMIPRHVVVHDRARCTGVERVENGYRVSWRQDGKDHQVLARYVVGADGAASAVRHTAYPGAEIRTYLSIQQWFEDCHATPFYSCVFDPDSTDCYAWGLSKNKHFIFGGAFAPRHARKKFDSLKEKLKEYGFQFSQPIKTEACLVLRPSGLFDCRCGRDGLFLLGEAAGFISSSSLEGISHALNSAYKLGRILNSGCAKPNFHYWLKTLSLRFKLFAKYLKVPFMYYPPLRWLVMRSGLGSIPVEPLREE